MHGTARALTLLVAAAFPSAVSGTPCSNRTDDLPCLSVPPCGHAPPAVAAPFYVNGDAGLRLAAPQTSVAVCHNASGLKMVYQADDAHVVTPWTRCNDPVFTRSSTLEFFASPVHEATDNPIWYHEIDVAPSGVMWAGVSNNSKGNATTCDASAGDSCVPGTLACTGMQTFPPWDVGAQVRNTSSGWSASLFVPFAMFPGSFVSRGGASWPLWRLGLYRYAYPHGPDAGFSNYQLSAWSPTHTPSFHEPERFGVARLVDASGEPLPFPSAHAHAADDSSDQPRADGSRSARGHAPSTKWRAWRRRSRARVK